MHRFAVVICLLVCVVLAGPISRPLHVVRREGIRKARYIVDENGRGAFEPVKYQYRRQLATAPSETVDGSTTTTTSTPQSSLEPSTNTAVLPTSPATVAASVTQAIPPSDATTETATSTQGGVVGSVPAVGIGNDNTSLLSLLSSTATAVTPISQPSSISSTRSVSSIASTTTTTSVLRNSIVPIISFVTTPLFTTTPGPEITLTTTSRRHRSSSISSSVSSGAPFSITTTTTGEPTAPAPSSSQVSTSVSSSISESSVVGSTTTSSISTSVPSPEQSSASTADSQPSTVTLHQIVTIVTTVDVPAPTPSQTDTASATVESTSSSSLMLSSSSISFVFVTASPTFTGAIGGYTTIFLSNTPLPSSSTSAAASAASPLSAPTPTSSSSVSLPAPSFGGTASNVGPVTLSSMTSSECTDQSATITVSAVTALSSAAFGVVTDEPNGSSTESSIVSVMVISGSSTFNTAFPASNLAPGVQTISEASTAAGTTAFEPASSGERARDAVAIGRATASDNDSTRTAVDDMNKQLISLHVDKDDTNGKIVSSSDSNSILASIFAGDPGVPSSSILDLSADGSIRTSTTTITSQITKTVVVPPPPTSTAVAAAAVSKLAAVQAPNEEGIGRNRVVPISAL